MCWLYSLVLLVELALVVGRPVVQRSWSLADILVHVVGVWCLWCKSVQQLGQHAHHHLIGLCLHLGRAAGWAGSTNALLHFRVAASANYLGKGGK